MSTQTAQGRLAVLDQFGTTERRDNWAISPIVTGVVLLSFVAYGTFRAIWAIWFDSYHYGHTSGRLEDHAYVLSPFFSPLITGDWMPAWISPAFLILWAPGGFRVTCYYYRKAYYRALFMDPVACGVGEPSSLCGVPRGKAYEGETRLLLFQNLHRYFLYIAIIFLFLLLKDFVDTLIWPTENGGRTFGMSVASLVLFANWALLSSYTLSCHSLRHLIGGALDRFTGSGMNRARYTMWTCSSALNKDHMLYAWLSLFGVALTDLYVWMVATGNITDIRLL
jgi:hypothetical protein